MFADYACVMLTIALGRNQPIMRCLRPSTGGTASDLFRSKEKEELSSSFSLEGQRKKDAARQHGYFARDP